MKILLIQPCDINDIEYKVAVSAPYMGIKSLFAPHALATIAALTPQGNTIKIFDEAIDGTIEDSDILSENWDIMGIHLTTNLINRCKEIGEYFSKNAPDTYRIAGGIGATLISGKKIAVFQSVFHGEAEDSWQEFLSDFKNNTVKTTYKTLTHPDMIKVPVPRWDLIKDKLPYYGTVPIQTTRGCPFDCNFCNVIYTYGRKMRCKSVEQVIDEVKFLHDLGVNTVFFADDNFAGKRKYAKEILYRLKEVNNSFDVPLSFMTQLDITIAKDEELLELLADCNFVELMIGVEAIDPETLKEMNKVQNLKDDIQTSLRKIQSYGLSVFAHMIVGFDNDTMAVFDRIKNFFAEVGITEYLLHPLMAPPGTRLWYQLKKESRVVDTTNFNPDTTDIVPNIMPKKLSRVELMQGLLDFWETVNHPRENYNRALTFFNNINRIPEVKKPGFALFKKMSKYLFGTFKYFMFKAPKGDKKAFFALMNVIRKKSPALMNKLMFLYTNYMMNRDRTILYKEILLEQIRIEKENPDFIQALSPVTPIPDSIRQNSKDIFLLTYNQLREKLKVKDLLFSAIIETVTDYSNQFGDKLTNFDKYQEKNLENCVLRVLNTGEWKDIKSELKEIAEEKFPAGLDNELLNTLDNNIRLQMQMF